MCGTFGYELDATHLSKEDHAVCKEQSDLFRKYYPLIIKGDYYRLTDPFREGPCAAWEQVSPDRREALVSLVTGSAHAAPPFSVLRLKGLDPCLTYQINGQGAYPGDVLMEAGWPLPMLQGDYQSMQLYLSAV